MIPSAWRGYFHRPSRPAPRRRNARLILETLENRLTPAVHIWTGASGTSANWSDPANWSGGVPAAGESNVVLGFGPIANSSQLVTNDDIGGLTAQQINFTTGGYVLNGGAFLTLTGGISDQSPAGSSSNTISLGITLAGQATVQVVDPTHHLALNGQLIGPGGFTKVGPGGLDLGGAASGNAYGGTTTVNEGALNLNKFQAVPGPLVIGDGVGGPNADQVFLRTFGATGSAIPVTINTSGELILGDGQSLTVSDTIGSLDMTGGEVLGTASGSSGMSSSSPSLLTIAGGGVTTHPAAAPARIDANLDLGGRTQAFNIADGPADPDLIVTGVISDSGFSSSFPITPVIPSADLGVTKTAPGSVGAGGLLSYTITVSNAGPTDATNVSLTDIVPQGTAFRVVNQQAGNGTTFSCAELNSGGKTTVVCSASDLPPFQPAVFTLVVQVNPGAADGSTVTNTASVTSSTPDPNPANNTASATTTVNAQADLWVRIPNPPPQTSAGTPATYTITLTNLGPSAANAVNLTDSFPGAGFVSVMQTGGPTTVTCNPPGPNTPTQVSCTAASIPQGETDTFQVVVMPQGSSGPAPLTNTATVSSTNPDPNPDNNTATVTSFSSSNLTVTKTGPATVTAGTDVTYSITVSNSGPSTAENVSLSDTLPTGESLVSESQTGHPTFTCFNSGGGINCSANDLAAGQTVTFQMVAHISSATQGSTIANVATAVATNAPTTFTNSSTATSTLNTVADLGITKAGPPVAGRGQTISYTISVTNNGPSDAQNVVVTDMPPAGTTFAGSSSGVFTCSQNSSAGVITCTDPTLAASRSSTILLGVTVNPQTPNNTTLTNTATVSSGTTDNNPQNNSASASTTVVPTADLAVTKSGPSSATPGGDITYTISLTNNGPDTAQAVSLTDTVPSGTTFGSVAQTGGSTAFSCGGVSPGGTGTLTCSAGAFPSGQSATFQLVVHVNPSGSSGSGNGFNSGVFNSASVSSQTNDPNSFNNSAFTFASLPSTSGAGITKTGAGTLVLTADNIYKGPTTVNGGVLLVDGAQSGGPAVVNAGGVLGGHGTLGATTVNAGGVLSPEDSDTGTPALLTVGGGLTFVAGGVFRPHLAGTTPGGGYSQLHVTGAVTLGDALLQPIFTFAPKDTDSFTLIAPVGTAQVTGLFQSSVGRMFVLEEGAIVPGLNTSHCFTISYKNHAVVLTGVNEEELFVRAVYAGLGLTPDASIPGYVKELQNSTLPLAQARAAVVRKVWESDANRKAQVDAFFAGAQFLDPNTGIKDKLIKQLEALHGQNARREGNVFADFIASREFKLQHGRPRDFVLTLYLAILKRLPKPKELRQGIALAKQGKTGRQALVAKLLSSNQVYMQAILSSFLTLFGNDKKASGSDLTGFIAQMKAGIIDGEDFFVVLTTDPRFVNAFLKHFMALCGTGPEAGLEML